MSSLPASVPSLAPDLEEESLFVRDRRSLKRSVRADASGRLSFAEIRRRFNDDHPGDIRGNHKAFSDEAIRDALDDLEIRKVPGTDDYAASFFPREPFDPSNLPSRGRARLSNVVPIRSAIDMRTTAPAVLPPVPDLVLPTRWGGWNKAIEPPVYLLEGLIPQGKVVVFYAEGGSVKSWALLSLAISVATGAPWLGTYAVRKGSALIVDYEDGPYEFQRRRARLEGQGVDALATLPDIPDLGYVYAPGALNDETTLKAIANEIKSRDLQNPLLCVDSYGAGMPADADENSTTFAASAKMLGRLTEMFPTLTIVVVHHANKSGGMRGTSALRDQVDVAFRFEPVSETDDTKRMRMICEKPGPQKKPAPVNLQLSDAGLATFEDEAQVTGRNAESFADVEAAIKLALMNGPIETKKLLRTAVGGKSAKVSAALEAMIVRKEVVKLQGSGYALDDDKARTSRVFTQVRDFDFWTTEAQLAKASNVETSFVRELVRKTVIAPRSTGRDGAGGFFIVTKPHS